jgi:arylsulfatase A-like enzyme
MSPLPLVGAALCVTLTLHAARPNVLLIGVDDLNDWIGCLGGHPQARTPHLDRLAASGTLFTNAHCQAPLCNPSRTSILTGRRPTTTGVYGLSPWFRTAPALRELVSLPQAFARAGYHTAVSGKIYHVFPPAPDREEEVDEYGVPCNFGPLPKKKFVETPANHRLVDWGIFPAKDEQQNDWAITTWGVEFLQREHSQPFFLGVGLGRPHVPCFASQPWFDLYPADSLKMPRILRDDRADVPEFAWYLNWRLPEVRLPWLEEAEQWRPLVRSYLAAVSFADSQIGRLLDALEASGASDHTLVVLFSDHGWHLGEKGISGKNTLWEETTRVPLIVAGPGVPEGQRCGQPAELLDIYPTLLDLAGLEAVAGLEGQSLRPQLSDPEQGRRPALTTHCPGNHGVRSERWRYIVYADGSEELYDHANDPMEWHNLADREEHAGVIRRLRRFLPETEADFVVGSAGRTLEKRRGVWLWEGQPVEGLERSR